MEKAQVRLNLGSVDTWKTTGQCLEFSLVCLSRARRDTCAVHFLVHRPRRADKRTFTNSTHFKPTISGLVLPTPRAFQTEKQHVKMKQHAYSVIHYLIDCQYCITV